MSNNTNLGILPFLMVKIAGDNHMFDGYGHWLKQQQLQLPQRPKGLGTLDLFGNGNGYINADGELGKTPIEAARARKSKKRGFLSTLLSSTSKAIKSPAVDAALVGGSGGTAILYNLLGDDNNSLEASEAPKALAKSEPKAEVPKAEAKTEASTAEPTPVTTAPSTSSDSTPKPSTTTPANGAGGSGGRTTTITTVTHDNRDFIDQGLQAINDFKAKHPELFWSGVGLAGLGSIYALTKALDDDDDDEDYYYYRHR